MEPTLSSKIQVKRSSSEKKKPLSPSFSKNPKILFYTPTESAQVIGIPVKAVNKILDIDHIGHGSKRQLTSKDLLYVLLISKFREMAEIKQEGRSLLKAEVDGLFKKASDLSTILDKQLQLFDFKFELEPFVQQLKQGLTKLKKAKSIVAEDSDVLGGEVVIKGTRISVYLIASMLEEGATHKEILQGYPSLTEKQIELAKQYALAYPRRGRPSKHVWGKIK